MTAADGLIDGELWHRRAADLINRAAVIYGGVTSGGANVYEIAPEEEYQKIDRLIDGERFRLIAHQTNTGASTFNPDTGTGIVGALSIVRPDGSGLQAGDIRLGYPFELMYQESGNRFLLLSNGSELLTGHDGWNRPVDSEWSFGGLNRIDTSVSYADRITAGDKLRLVQSGSTKYFYVTSVSSTQIFLTGGADYVLSGTFSSPAYSHAATPVGFPQYFAHTPILGAGGAMTITAFTVHLSRFTRQGKKCTYEFVYWLTFGGVATEVVTASLPFASPNIASAAQHFNAFYHNDTTDLQLGVAAVGNNSSTLYLYKQGFATWTLGAARELGGVISYEIA